MHVSYTSSTRRAGLERIVVHGSERWGRDSGRCTIFTPEPRHRAVGPTRSSRRAGDMVTVRRPRYDLRANVNFSIAARAASSWPDAASGGTRTFMAMGGGREHVAAGSGSAEARRIKEAHRRLEQRYAVHRVLRSMSKVQKEGPSRRRDGDMDIGGFAFEGQTPGHEQVEVAGYGSESEYLRYIRGRRCGEASLSVVSRGAVGGGRARGVTSVGSVGSPPSRYA